MIQSLYQISYKMPDDTWLQLADFGDWLDSEPVFPGTKEIDFVPIYRAEFLKPQARGNIPRAITFSRIYEHQTANDARRFELDHLTILDSILESTLTLGIKDSETYEMNDAMLIGQPRAKDTNALPATSIVIDYTIYGGAIFKVPSSTLDLYVSPDGDFYVQP